MGVPELLVATGAYRDLEAPVVVTSGEFLTPFFVNAERLCGDPEIDAALAAHGNDDGALVRYACSRAAADPGFRETVRLLAAAVRRLASMRTDAVISGGQRRDWLFSGPVSRELGVPHLALYKQEPGQGEERDRLVLRDARGVETPATDLRGRTAVHVVDMITAASSCLSRDPLSGRDVGWVPMLRARGMRIEDLVAVVSRRQGGEEALARAGVAVTSLAVVDEAFLAERSRKPAEAVAYYRGAEEWTRRWLAEHGVALLASYFVDDPKKLPRLRKFLRTYRSFLEARGLWADVDAMARGRLGVGAAELCGGEA